MKKSNLVVLTLAFLACVSHAAEKKKRVIVCTVTTGFRHSSIPYAEAALEKLGKESGAYEIVDFARQPTGKNPPAPRKPKDLKPDATDADKARYAEELKGYEEQVAKAASQKSPFDEEMRATMAKLSPDSLRAQKIDMVIFANTTGELPLPDREGFIKWIEDGHGFCAMHSGSDTFHHFPAYLDMLQGQFAGHGRQVPADLVAGDVSHPANGGIGEKWDLAQEEMYLIKHHDRAKIRALWYLRHHPNDKAKEGYNAVSWCRMAEKGRVFYTSLGHREDLWSDDPSMKGRVNPPGTAKQFHAHILGGIKWALGLEKGEATPNPDVK